jgi:hypothetical protein
MAITRNPVTAYIRNLDKDDKSKRATLTDITPNPVPTTTTTTVPKPSIRPTLTNITGQALLKAPSGTKVYGTGRNASTSGEEKLDLIKAAETVKRRITTNLALTPKQKQNLLADADRIAAGERQEVALGGSAPSLLKKLQDVAYSKILSPFKSAYKTGGDFSIESQGKAWAGAISGVINPANRFGQSISKELSDIQLSIDNPVLKGLVKSAGRVVLPIPQIGADIISMGNTKEQLLKRSDVGGDKIEFSVIDLVNQVQRP